MTVRLTVRLRMRLRMVLLTALCLVPGVARAFSTGVFGFSGKDGADCSQCHTGTGAATVTLSGPQHLLPGEHGSYTFDVVTGATSNVAGLDVAASAGTLVSLTQNNPTFLNNGEISHKGGPAKGATVQWRFELVAPTDASTVTLFGAGLAANANGGTSGDNTGTTSLLVSIGDPPDLAGADLSGAPPPDLSTVDAVSAASPPEPMTGAKVDLGPPHDDPTWACACDVGGRPKQVAWWPLGLGLLAFLFLRHRRN